MLAPRSAALAIKARPMAVLPALTKTYCGFQVVQSVNYSGNPSMFAPPPGPAEIFKRDRLPTNFIIRFASLYITSWDPIN